MKTETEPIFEKVTRHLLRIDIVLLIALSLIGALGIKDLINTTKTTKALSEVAQKVGVDFPTSTNNVLGVWQVIKPR